MVQSFNDEAQFFNGAHLFSGLLSGELNFEIWSL
jgi:hypothetical protein